MKPDDITKLERLAALRDRGGLTETEFDIQKAAIMAHRRGAPVVLIGSAAALLVALIVVGGLWMSRRHESAAPAVAASLPLTDHHRRSSAAKTQASPAPIPAPSAKAAFNLVYPVAKAKVYSRGETY